MLNYHSCTAAELQSFIKARTGHDAKPKQARFSYISILRQLDRDATFRFMDLPPEMRNLVYRELLSLNRGKGENSCFPKIFVASKQIHGEANGILYGDYVLEIKLKSGAGSYDVVVDTKAFKAWGAATLRGAFDQWPSYLRKMHRIRITAIWLPLAPIYGTGPPIPASAAHQNMRRANLLFYTLASHLAVSRCLTSLDINIKAERVAHFADSALAILAPLEKLGPAVSKITTITGIPAGITETLLERMRHYERVQLGSVRDRKDLLKRAIDVLTTAKSVAISRSRDALVGGIHQLEAVLDAPEYMDAYRDRVLADAVEALQQLFRGGLQIEVRRAVTARIGWLEEMNRRLA